MLQNIAPRERGRAPGWARLGVGALLAAVTSTGLVAVTGGPAAAATPPSGAPTDLKVTQRDGQDGITVTWTSAGVTWGTGDKPQYQVSLDTGQDFTPVVNSCNGWIDAAPGSGINTCSFNGIFEGTYTVTVTPVTLDGTSASTANASTVLTAPSGGPNDLTLVQKPGTAEVTVTWSNAGVTWGSGGFHRYYTQVDPPGTQGRGLATNTCGPSEAAATNTCSFTADMSGDYTVTVQPIGFGIGEGTRKTLSVRMPAAAPTTPPTDAPKAPATVPTDAISVGSAAATPDAQVTMSGSGFQPGSTVRLTVYSAPVDLGTATVAADGTFSKTVTLPSGLPAGSHTLLATGLAPGGAVRYLSKALTVSASGLPVTGAGATGIAVAALALLGLGIALVAATNGRIVRRLRPPGLTG